ncbi:MAG: neutral zinc metalloprotease [Curvibacter sp.]|nr:MAG: neutral zinc metalloprotease [Curvibacter sp.]
MSAPNENKLASLRDRRHALLAQVAGLEIEIAMELNDRPAACEAQVRMFAEVAARRALRGLDLNGGQ